MSTTSQETIERLKEQAAQEAEEIPVVDVEPVEEEVTPAGDSPDPEKNPTREYVIITGWTEVARVVAGTPEAAILGLGEHLKDGTKYGVAPSRYWHEKTPAIKTTTSIELK